MTKADTVIIGAGPAGLTAAYLLTQHGRSVTIIEADPHYVGGISRTVNYKGFLFDIGGHRFFSKSAEIVALWREILPDDFIRRPRLSRIYYGGKYYSYPLRAGEALGNLGLVEAGLCVLSYLKARLFPRRDVKTFHQWVSNQFGERLYRMFFKTYTEKVWGMSCDEISADWAAQRIKGLNLLEAATAALRKSLWPDAVAIGKDGRPIKTLIEQFDYPRLGPGMMWEAAAASVVARGGVLHMGQALGGITRDSDSGRYIVSATDQLGRQHRYEADHVISSAPLRDLADAIEPQLASRSAADGLRYRDFITVALIVDQPDLFDDNWIYIHDPAVKVGRIQNFRSWSPDMVPDPKLACLGLEYFCFEGDTLWTSSDEELIALARRELATIGLASEADCIDGCVVRQQKAYPVYDETYKTHVEAIRGELAERMPNLHLVGRNGMHKYNNQDHAMMTAMLAVENIVAGRQVYDVWNVNEDAEYHEAGEGGRVAALASLRAVPQRVR
ncbi:NAD(P)/FAD-dependent oxidoreductase [Phreatobacter sp.]|uniref:NAD(P)/FAD-dependent oxidoreductase n=1 Tax=Phreatobacter sp. TaxID=1966341 RepID=UPI0022C70ABD|nr:NAD(P)/FAD-dependent oxidoreductase [Phreatobacter sp.]MCZ8316574.1 NAD(P)/FAD-dependent oxidoreductase [Phreatobacter sp.]